MSGPRNGKELPPRPARPIDEEEVVELHSVGIVRHPKTRQWVAYLMTTRGQNVERIDTLTPHSSIEHARLDAKELLIARVLYREGLV